MVLPFLVVFFPLSQWRQGMLAILLYELGMTAWLLWDHGERGRPFEGRRGRAALWLAVIGMGVAAGPLLHFLWPYLGLDGRWDLLRAEYGLNGWRWSAFLILFAIPNPILEERVWRGHLGGTGLGVETADFAFALYHVAVLMVFVSRPWALLGGVVLLAAAWVWRWAAATSGGLLLPTLSHLAASIGIALVLILRG